MQLSNTNYTNSPLNPLQQQSNRCKWDMTAASDIPLPQRPEWWRGLWVHKLIQEPWESRRQRSAVITCGSLLPESTSRICVYFSSVPKGTELLEERPQTHEQHLIQAACSISPVLFIVMKTAVAMKTKWLASCSVTVASFCTYNNRLHPDKRAHDLFKYISGNCFYQ